MANCWRGLVPGMVVVVGLLAVGQAQEVRGPAREVVELAREAEAGKDVEKKAVALRKRFRNARAAMNLFNPRSRGGIGVGPRGTAIEQALIGLEEEALTAQALKKESAELVRVAHITLVMAEITDGFPPAKPFLGKGKKEWERDVGAMKKAARDLLKALEARSPREVKAAATRINTACTNCHDGK